MGEFKKGDFVRATASDETIAVGDVGIVAENSPVPYVDWLGKVRWAYVESDMEPWRPRVGERVRYRNATYGEAIVKETLPDGRFVVDTEGRYGICTERLKSLEPILSISNTAPKQPATLKIEAGKFYKTRDGRKVGPIVVDSQHDRRYGWTVAHEFNAEYGKAWRGDGTFHPDVGTTHGADIIAEWIDEPFATQPKPSNDNAQPKFKVGDLVIDTESSEGYTAIVRDISTDRFTIEWLEDGKPSGTRGNWPFDDFELITPPTTTIVALIDNGQPKPSSTPHVHASTGAAKKEAKRLAAKFKGKQFGVFTLTTTHEEAAPVYDHKWQNLAVLGLKIDAIKELRSITGMGLKPAKDAVEYFLDAA